MPTNSLHNSFVKSSIYISTDQVGIINLTQEICGGYEKVADGCAFFKKHHKISKQQAKRTSEIFQHCTVCCIRIIKKINWSFPVMKLVNFQGSIEMKRDENWNEPTNMAIFNLDAHPQCKIFSFYLAKSILILFPESSIFLSKLGLSLKFPRSMELGKLKLYGCHTWIN